jgi:hypothetical protein
MMVRLSTFTEYKGEVKHLKLKRDPSYYGIGHYRDDKNILWDVWGIIHKTIYARPVDNSSLYRTDSDSIYEGYNLTYLPYTFSVIKD